MLSLSDDEITTGRGRVGDLQKQASDEGRRLGIKEKEIHLSAGDIVFWQERLLHGGRPILNPRRSRRSIAGHYICCRSGDTWRPEALRRSDVLMRKGSKTLFSDAKLWRDIELKRRRQFREHEIHASMED